MKKILLVAFFVAFTFLLKAQQVTPTTTTIIRGLSSSVGSLIDNWEGYTPNQGLDDWYINPNGAGYQTFYSYCGIEGRGANPLNFNGTNFSNTGTFLIKDHTNEYGYSNVVTVTVIDSYVTSPGAVSSGQSICSGSTPSLLTLSGVSGENIHYKWLQKIGTGSWTIIPGATGLTYQPPSLTQNTTYMVNVYIYDDSFYKSSVSANIIIYSTSVNAGSFISSTICYNTSTTLTQATSPLGGSGDYTYQWEDSPDGITYTAITGAASASYTTPALTASKNFRRLVTTAACGYSSYCTPFSVTVNPDVNPGSITADQTICNSTAPALLSTGTSPTGGNSIFSFQWLSSLDNSTYNPVSGATGTSYQPGSLTQTTYYIKQIVNSCKTVLTSPVIVTVKGALDGGTIRNTQTICYNTTPSQIATSVFPAGGMGIYTNAWEYSLDGSLWFNITGETLSAYQPGALTQTTFYRKKVTDSSCGYTYSNTVTVKVRTNFSKGSISSSQTICYNNAPINLTNNVSPSGGSEDYAYQWEYSTDNTNFFVISGATGATYQPGALTVTTYYKRKVTDAGCGNGYTPTVTIAVKSNFSVGTIGNSQTICYNGTPILLNTDVAPSGGMGVYTYQWESCSNGTDWSAISGATGVSYQPGTLTSSTYYHRKVIDSSCGSGFSTSILITVRSPFASGAIGLDQQICYSSAPNLLTTTTAPTGGSNSFTYTWESSFDNTNWNVISGAAGTSYQPGILTTKTYYRKSVTDICGSGYTNTMAITVRPILKVGDIGYSEIICYGYSPSIIVSKVAPSGGSGSYTYEWSSGNNGINWNLIPSATGETYQPGILTQTAYFRRKVIDVCGSEYSLNDTVTVRPALVPGSISSNQSICYNTAPSRFTSLSLPSGATGVYTYQWQSSINNVSWSNISGATSEEHQPLPMISSLYFRRLETSGSCGTAQTNSIFITLNSQLVAGSIKSDETICYGHSPCTMITNTAPVGGMGTYSYQWQKLVGTAWTDIPGATTETFTSNALTSTSYFRRTETSGSCGTVISNQIAKTVLQQFSGGIIGSSQTISYNTAPILLTSLQSPSGATLPYSFQWMKSEDNSYFVNVNGATSETYQPGNLALNTYFKRVTSSSTCGSVETNTVTITVNNQLLPGIVTADQTICFKSAPNLLTGSAPSGGIGLFSYQWMKSFNNTDWINIEGEVGSSIQPGILNENTYFRRGVTSGANSSFSNSVKVTVYQPLNTPITDAKSFYCKGTSFQLSVLNPVYVSYKWYDSSQNYLQDGTIINVTNFSSDAKYYLKAVNSLGCFSDPVKIPLFVDNVHAGFTNDITTVTLGSAVKFTSTSVNSNSVSWNFFEGDIIHETSPVHYYNTLKGSNSNKFDVKLNVVSPNGCLDSLLKKDLIKVVNDVTGIESNEIVTFSYYPNPVTEKLYLSSSKRIRTVKIFTVSGNLIESLKFNDESIIIDLEKHKSGIYFLEINVAQETKKIIKIIKQ